MPLDEMRWPFCAKTEYVRDIQRETPPLLYERDEDGSSQAGLFRILQSGGRAAMIGSVSLPALVEPIKYSRWLSARIATCDRFSLVGSEAPYVDSF